MAAFNGSYNGVGNKPALSGLDAIASGIAPLWMGGDPSGVMTPGAASGGMINDPVRHPEVQPTAATVPDQSVPAAPAAAAPPVATLPSGWSNGGAGFVEPPAADAAEAQRNLALQKQVATSGASVGAAPNPATAISPTGMQAWAEQHAANGLPRRPMRQQRRPGPQAI